MKCFFNLINKKLRIIDLADNNKVYYALNLIFSNFTK